MKIIDFSIRRPVSVFIFAVAAVVFGMVAFRKLATDLLPDITYPSLSVQTTYEGAAPVEVESLITRPVENAVGVVNNVVRVISSSRTDVSEVTLEFGWGTNMDLAAHLPDKLAALEHTDPHPCIAFRCVKGCEQTVTDKHGIHPVTTVPDFNQAH